MSADYAAERTDGGAECLVRLIQARVAVFTTPERFRQVMDRVMTLAHPNLLPTLDCGVANDSFFVVTAPRAPANLRERLRLERELPIPDALRVAREIAAGLALAHTHGVRHGDLRPKHVDLTQAGAVLAGTGVADALIPSGPGDLTSTVISIGSPTYLSPEQIMRTGIPDARSDVYSLGVMLYEMLAGEPPFGRATRGDAVANKLGGRYAPLRDRRDRVSPRTEELVRACLERVPADRPRSAAEVAEALAAE